FVDIDLSGLDFNSAPLNMPLYTRNNLAGEIQSIINSALPSGSSVTVGDPGTGLIHAGPNGPVGEDNRYTVVLRIASANGDVRIEPAATFDLATRLMLGTAQGGIEVSRYAQNRPAPTGLVFNLGADLANLVTFAEQEQTAFGVFRVNTIDIDLTNTLETSGGATDRMYQDGYDPSITGNSDGVREKWAIIANAINAEKASDPTFKWSAEVWGSRLALIPGDGGEDSQGNVVTSDGDGVDIGPGDLGLFTQNVRYYSLGPSGQGDFQIPAGAPASDGNAPTLTNYRNAFEVLDKEVDLFNLMILPTDEDHSAGTTASLWGPASVFCQKRRAFLLMDPPASWETVQNSTHPSTGVNSLRVGLVKDHSAIFYPRITITENGLKKNIGGSGAVAGLMARIDGSRGVWKAPAGTEADLRGIVGLEYRFSDDENGVLNPRSINTLRVFPNGIVSWGARTMDGDDDFASEYKYIPVRRLALFMEESLYRGLKWVVFEPNDEPLWAQIRLNVGAFMHNLFRQGAFQGEKPKDAYFVKCDSETTTQNDINLGIVNIWVGFAPLKPAEFVILYLQQMAGQIEV
ncbi:MAG: phage tail sheath family protein, partial [Desulfobulbaceae bacterium]|nr:phage tail sheath family protein [Desulfobulbaceae bacterium]